MRVCADVPTPRVGVFSALLQSVGMMCVIYVCVCTRARGNPVGQQPVGGGQGGRPTFESQTEEKP